MLKKLPKIQKNHILDSELIVISDAARIMGVSKDTIRRWEKLGKITSERTNGGHRRYHLSDLKLSTRAKSQKKESVKVFRNANIFHSSSLYQELHIEQKKVLKRGLIILFSALIVFGFLRTFTFVSQNKFFKGSAWSHEISNAVKGMKDGFFEYQSDNEWKSKS